MMRPGRKSRVVNNCVIKHNHKATARQEQGRWPLVSFGASCGFCLSQLDLMKQPPTGPFTNLLPFNAIIISHKSSGFIALVRESLWVWQFPNTTGGYQSPLRFGSFLYSWSNSRVPSPTQGFHVILHLQHVVGSPVGSVLSCQQS